MTILTDTQVLDIRQEVARGLPHKVLAKRYGIAKPTVSAIVTGMRRPNAPGPITKRSERTHCVNGHPITETNRSLRASGYYVCLDCEAYYRKIRAEIGRVK